MTEFALHDTLFHPAEGPENAPSSLSRDSLRQRMARVKGVLLDMDGVIYRGNTLLPDVLEFLDFLEASRRSVLYVTNNATRTPAMFVDKLAAMGIQAVPSQILTSAEATGGWMERHAPAGSKVQLVGGAGVWSALLARGFEPANSPTDAQYVVVGMDFNLDYRKVADATLAIAAGAEFIGTNEDATFPSEEGDIPGAGSIVALLKTATGKTPTVIGKPYPGMFEEAMARLGLSPDECLMVGDRYETDIQGAQELSIWTAGVCTGVTSWAEFKAMERPPNFVFRDMRGFLDLFREARLFASQAGARVSPARGP